MSKATLEEHTQRVSQAQADLEHDVQRLSDAGREISRKAKAGTVWLLFGAGALVGALVVRAMYRRARRLRVTSPPYVGSYVSRSSLLGDAVRLLVLEAVRQGGRRIALRLLPSEHELRDDPRPALFHKSGP
jgi:hypothetical protein